jgi:predicted membrane channel-forming protein YqfA (hemolysin III family)
MQNIRCTTDSGIAQYNFKCLVSFTADMINQLVWILIGIGLLLFIFGLVKYVSAGGDEDKVKEAKSFIIFGIIALFVMLSVWGLVNILTSTFFPGGGVIIPQFR